MKRLRSSTIFYALIIIVVFINGCSPHQQENQVKIGGLFGLTGYAAFAGEASRDGFLMAIEDSGMDVKYIVEDFSSDTKTAVTAANKLIDVDKVNVIIGPEWAEFGAVVAPIAENRKMLFISPWLTTEPAWLKEANYYFSGTASERSLLRHLIEYMSKQKVKKIVIIYSNNEWSFGNVDIFKEEAKKFPSIEIIGEFKVAQEANDFKTEITKVKELQPDAIYAVISTDSDQGILNKQLRELSANYQIYLPYSRAESSVLMETYEDVMDGAIYADLKEYKNMKSFNEKYEERFGKKPSAISAATAYDMTTLVLEAMKNGAISTDQIREYLRNKKNYEGYSNLITFNEFGQVTAEETVIKQIDGKTYKVLE